jgi:hypothetical protein
MSRSKHTQSRNLTAVDGGSAATYFYDSLNERVQEIRPAIPSNFEFSLRDLPLPCTNKTTIS